MVIRVLLLLSLLSLTFEIQTIDCHVQGCLSCRSPNICEICDQNLVLSSIEGSSFLVCLRTPNSDDNILIDTITTTRILQTCSIPGCLTCGSTANVCTECKMGYYINSTRGCTFCNAPCETCISATNCTACYGGYNLQQDGTCKVTCTVTGCSSCVKQNQCETCMTGYTLDSTSGQCTQQPTASCTLIGCIQCSPVTIGNICLNCETGYVIGSDGQCIKETSPSANCPISNCINCSSTGTCLTCILDNNMYLPSPTGKECIICDRSIPNMAGCLSCANRSSCEVCSSGLQHTIYKNMGICIKCTIPNCLHCVFNGTVPTCDKCSIGYSPVLMGELCYQCSFPCATCRNQQIPNVCETCALPHFFSLPAADGTCIKNYIQGCVRPNLNNHTLCAVCSPGFTLSPDGLLCNFTCSLNCVNCASSTNCTTCVQGFYLTRQLICEKCIIGGCEACSADGKNCTSCLKGFYLAGIDCAPCPSFCLNCTSNTSCSSLSEQSQVLMTIDGQSVLASCEVTCLKCSETDNGVCFTCHEGFFLASGKCRKCSGNCKTCDPTNPQSCLSCYANNFLSSQNLCVMCNKNCLTCLSADNPNNCTTCWDGFSLDSSSTCVKGCPKNCFTCTNLTSCTRCLSGYTTYQVNGSVLCAPCTTNCRSCANGRPSVCLSCGTGLYLNGRTCKKCSSKCQKCTVKGCRACISGYYLTSDQICAPRCKSPCATCSPVNAQSCLTCMAGYLLNGTLCAPLTNCTENCNICPDGFTLRNGRCTACNTEKCQSCNSVNLTECYSCQRGFYLNSSGTCETCPAQCQECLSSTGCLTCAVGYTIKENAVQTASGFECVKCNSPCATCINNPDYCTSCVAGFDFSGWKCAQIFKFSFNLTLTVNMTVFEEKYMSFILALASAARISDINGITLNSITAGSVILEGNVAPEAASGTAEAGTQLEGLKTALQSGEIEGMPVGSSSIVVEDGIAGVEDESSKNMLPIILGICIPIGLLVIIGVVVYFVYGKKNEGNVNRLDTYGDENKGENFNKTNEQMSIH